MRCNGIIELTLTTPRWRYITVSRGRVKERKFLCKGHLQTVSSKWCTIKKMCCYR